MELQIFIDQYLLDEMCTRLVVHSLIKIWLSYIRKADADHAKFIRSGFWINRKQCC